MNEELEEQIIEVRNMLKKSLNTCYIQILRPQIVQAIEKIDIILKHGKED